MRPRDERTMLANPPPHSIRVTKLSSHPIGLISVLEIIISMRKIIKKGKLLNLPPPSATTTIHFGAGRCVPSQTSKNPRVFVLSCSIALVFAEVGGRRGVGER